ncbi:MAG: ABC transporter ATP-binding protein [Candidatus Rokubacteria bacterium]|nr:ABC transporter ATP-binding protein [Candidatus Rokubacteria bacterium]
MSQPARGVAVRLEGLSKRFVHAAKGEVTAVSDVSLEVPAGSLMTLLGPSGCGKTTCLRMVAGFTAPDAGRIWIGGRDVTHLAANHRNIGFVFQNYALFPHLNVLENVAYGLRVKRVPASEIADRVQRVLRLVGLAGYDRQFPNQLSGGEQQRVALARVIVVEPAVLLFDEPLSNLDAKLRVQMRAEVQRLQRALAITTLYVTHDQEEAMAISDQVAVMNRGELLQIGTPHQLYYAPRSLFAAQFIGRANLLAAIVGAASAEGVTLTLLAETCRVTVPDPRPTDGGSRSLVPGTRVRALVRPEAIGLSRGVRSGIPGKVVEALFLGEKSEYAVEVGAGERVTVTTSDPALTDLRPGDPVTLALRGELIRLFPEGSA